MCAKPEDPFLRRYSIGDFAKKAGVSTHFLKFYEEKGILHPKVQENGYRHYDIRDASVVLECRRMKNMGLSVREIEKGIHDCTRQEAEHALVGQEKVLAEELREQQMHLQGLQNLREAPQVVCAGGVERAHRAGHVVFAAHTE